MKNAQFPRMHVSYYVSDINKTIDFYSKFFEVKPVKTKDDYAKFILEEPGLNISFIKTENSVQSQNVHFGIETDNPEYLKQKLGVAMSQQLPILEENEVNCCYAKQDKFWVTDPDGYRWEVYQFKGDVETNDKSEEATACCEAVN